MTCGLSSGLWESGLVKFSAPGVLGSGQKRRSCKATGSSRWDGIRFAGKKPPVMGSRMGTANRPAFSSGVGTTPVSGLVSRMERNW